MTTGIYVFYREFFSISKKERNVRFLRLITKIVTHIHIHDQAGALVVYIQSSTLGLCVNLTFSFRFSSRY